MREYVKLEKKISKKYRKKTLNFGIENLFGQDHYFFQIMCGQSGTQIIRVIKLWASVSLIPTRRADI